MAFSLARHKDDEDCAAASKKELRSVIKTLERAASELRAAIKAAAPISPTTTLVSPQRPTVVEHGAQSVETLSLRNN